MMILDFLSFIKKERLFLKEDKILLAVSGGIDSIVMCDLFYKSGFKFGIAHCNFRLRGKESEQDEIFVADLAKKYRVNFHNIKFETEEEAKKQGLSIQMAARKLRYDWFDKIRTEHNYKYISIAHHRDDSIETYFINLLRGTGISGLRGILPSNNFVVRPLLFASRDKIVEYCKNNELEFREDSSNSSDKYLRNNLRINIIPKLKELNPTISETITQDMNRLREMEKIYFDSIQEKKQRIFKLDDNDNQRIAINELKKLHPIKSYLFEFLSPYNFNIQTVENIINSFEKTSGKLFFSSSHQVLKDRDELILSSIKKTFSTESFISENQNKIFSPIPLKITQENFSENFEIQKSANIAYIDEEKLKFPLLIRKWQKGDYFYPLGMSTKKKLSDFFIDLKLSLKEKEDVYLIESDNKICWIIGFRIDNRFKVNEKTKKIFKIESVES